MISEEGWLVYQLFITATYWAADMGFSFLSGFEEDGEPITDARRCARHYLKTGFPLDFVLICIDLVTCCFAYLPQQSGNLTDVTKGLRLLRLAGLVRLRKTSRLINTIMFDLNVEASASSMVRAVVFCIILTLLLSHLAACTWFWIGENAPTDTGLRWVNSEVWIGDESVRFLDTDPVYRYASVLHSHVDLFTIGNVNSEMVTTSTCEKAFQACNSIIALLLACTLVSIVSAILVDKHASKRSQTVKLRALSQYLMENRVRPQVMAQVLRQAKERIQRSPLQRSRVQRV